VVLPFAHAIERGLLVIAPPQAIATQPTLMGALICQMTSNGAVVATGIATRNAIPLLAVNEV
jgi:hypothetical protein